MAKARATKKRAGRDREYQFLLDHTILFPGLGDPDRAIRHVAGTSFQRSVKEAVAARIRELTAKAPGEKRVCGES